MIKYRTSNNSIEIKAVDDMQNRGPEVSYGIPGHRYHDTWEEARAYLLDRLLTNIRRYEEKIEADNNSWSELFDMKEPTE